METTIITPPPLMTFEQAMAMIDKKIEADKFAILAKIEADRKLHEAQMKKYERDIKKLFRGVGDLGHRLGDIVEYLISSNLKEKFDKYDFNFRNLATKVQINDENRKLLTDIDVLLYDGDCVMAVEVKTNPNIKDVNRHIKRMEQIQNYPPSGVENKKIFGAMAGAVVDPDIYEMCFDAGFFVISQTGENVEIVPPPKDFVPKFWTVNEKQA
jgi:hypothetical protein